MTHPLRIGTRGSPLALAQAQMVADALRARAGAASEIVPITTTGDMIQDRALAEVGGKALWTKELDRALLEGRGRHDRKILNHTAFRGKPPNWCQVSPAT